MSERRKALLRKFQAVAADRIRAISLALIELGEGRGGPADVHEVARELHTFKGESNMLGFARVSEVAHAAEALLLSGAPQGETPPPPSAEVCTCLLRALELADDAIQGRLAGDEPLVALLAELAAALADAPARTPAPGEHEAAAAPAPHAPHAPTAERWVPIDAARVDALCERIAGFDADFRALAARLGGLGEEVRAGGAPLHLLGEEMDRCRARLDDLTSSAWALRLAPIEPVLGELVRHAQKLAARQGKRVRVAVDSGGAAVERTLLDELFDPLLHLVQNAIDHGIEPPEQRGDKPLEARVTLHAEAVGASVEITVADDGRGIDVAAVRAAAERRGLVSARAALAPAEVLDLLFVHGFSTRDAVTDVSGRGVGLDVVRRKIESFGGTVGIASEPGRGTRFTLALPATVSRKRALVVELSGTLYGVACRDIVEIVRASDHAEGEARLRFRDEVVALRSLAGTLGLGLEREEPWALVLEAAGRRAAFTIPRAVGEHDLRSRPLDPPLSELDYLSASSTLDDGRLVLLLLAAGVLRRNEPPLHRSMRGAGGAT